MKICKTCNKNKELNDFINRSVSKDGHTDHCKLCVKLKRDSKSKEVKELIANKSKEWYRNNPEKVKEIKRVWKEDNGEEIKVYEQQWHFNNKENRAKQARSKYNDPKSNFKIKANLRTRFNNALKRGQKSGSAVSDLGCSIEDFKKYIESKWEPWMDWSNHGNYDKDKPTWQFDHINALANFDLSNREEFLKAAHYTNYQPLLALDNIIKSNKKEDV